MILVRTLPFKRDYQRLPPSIQRKADKALLLLVTNLRHPSLRVKKIQGAADIYEARVDIHYRLTFTLEGDSLILRAIGAHDKTLSNP